jgi:hypothetical protein
LRNDQTPCFSILRDFLYLSSEGSRASGHDQGLRHNIVHCGHRLEDLAGKDERNAIFRRLTRYAGATIRIMRQHSDEGWETIETARAAAASRLGLVGNVADDHPEGWANANSLHRFPTGIRK